MKYFLSLLLVAGFTATGMGQSNPRVKAGSATAQRSYSNTSLSTSSSTSTSSSGGSRDKTGIFGLHFTVGMPQDQFRTTSNNSLGFGLDLDLGFNPMHNVLDDDIYRPYLGLQLGYVWFNSKSDNYNTEDAFTTSAISSTVNSGAFNIGLFWRNEFMDGPVSPFVELNGGLRVFNGSHSLTVITTPRAGVSGTTARNQYNKNLGSDVTTYYGFGGGLAIRVGDVLRIDLKASYLYGGIAEYIDPNTIVFNRADKSVSFSNHHSTTNLLLAQVGISAVF